MLRAVANIRRRRFNLRFVSFRTRCSARRKIMQALSLERPGFAQNAIVSLATLAALALLGVVSAYWMWAWLAPRAEARAPAAQSAQLAGAADAASGLFGEVQRERSGSGTGAARLLGVIAPSGRLAGYALLRLDPKKTVAVLQG